MDITQRQITKIAREVGKFTVRTVKAEGVGTAEFDLIHAVRKNPGITQSEIYAILGTDKGAVAKQTANLEAKGYLRREANPADGRSQLIYPTEKAQSLKNSKAHIEALFYEWLAEALDGEGLVLRDAAIRSEDGRLYADLVIAGNGVDLTVTAEAGGVI